ncbi:MAG TPA: GIY-YIG nuclease family protein [Polyangiaceae bacterium]
MEELSELKVLVVDCQTTGASPTYGAVLEIGWGIACANLPDVAQAQAHWVTLPPGDFVDFQVRRLTGYHEAQVTSALSPDEAWHRLRSSMGQADPIPVAIHFAKFELAFLRDWASHFDADASFPFDAVCLHAIACRLYPDLPRRSLRALAGYLGYGLDPGRRCLPHVEATAFIWRKLAGELAALDVHTWDQLRDWIARPGPRPSRSKKRRYPLSSAKYRALPDAPGVYRLLRSNGDVLYVGKAASLRKRVASHFTTGSTTERALEMLTQVHDVEVAPTRTALEAALSENESIKALHPPYNVQLLDTDPRTWFCSSDLEDASTEPDAIHRWGPLPSTFSVHSLGAIRSLVSGERATRSLWARAVGASEYWAPDETVFRAGLACFAERHSLTVPSPASSVGGALVLVARKLILASKSASADGDSSAETSEPGTWDPERVVRHLERNVAHGYQLLQRARWLCLLHDSVIVFREPLGDGARVLVVGDGHLVDARDLAPAEPIPYPPASRPLRERQAAFDRSRYDRLRTLTTELKRVLRDGGTAAVRVGRGRWLCGSKLYALLTWV